MGVVINNTVVNVTGDSAVSVDKTKISGDIRKQVFCQIAVSDQSSKLKIQIDEVAIESLLDTEADVTIISPKSWHPD